MGVHCARGAIPMPQMLLEADRGVEGDESVEVEYDGFTCKFDFCVCFFECLT